jgi:hypothetical protein
MPNWRWVGKDPLWACVLVKGRRTEVCPGGIRSVRCMLLSCYCNIQIIQWIQALSYHSYHADSFPWRGFLSAFLDFDVEAGTSHLCSHSVSALFPFSTPVYLGAAGGNDRNQGECLGGLDTTWSISCIFYHLVPKRNALQWSSEHLRS